jgi:rhodanese-related sulfurtransferase
MGTALIFKVRFKMKMRKTTWLSGLLLLAVAALVAACGPATPGGDEDTVKGFPKNGDGYADISVEQLADLLDDKDFTLVNVHIPYEGEIPQTDLFIAYDEIGDHLDELPARDAAIVLYCRSGSMSTTAAKVLAGEGYTNVMEVDGGFNAWKAAGYDLLDKR